MKYAGRTENGKILIALDEWKDEEFFIINKGYGNTINDIKLKDKLIKENTDNLIEAKKELEYFLKNNKNALSHIAEAGLLVSILFQSKNNKVVKGNIT